MVGFLDYWYVDWVEEVVMLNFDYVWVRLICLFFYLLGECEICECGDEILMFKLIRIYGFEIGF